MNILERVQRICKKHTRCETCHIFDMVRNDCSMNDILPFDWDIDFIMTALKLEEKEITNG